ncbi:protein kinase C and casein kinase substrate in neurons protein 2 isoform X2 [Sitodiplosis mosellana]|uniref:protein kinase C and casein kinase substrate in neurons protein 2 isoform X2 n=1 Tax=Sitodiplosis mosellana TaxID=263140 RepID=UPI002443ADB3|nr:protein kinase C and casein kinase substrate in neurons protein 2 isoform X2 [Sitodiplosis mosellana]XP_055299779.1 protein kinase C and casein kinase substrate in neurons protein 2 isoform X2 [Sitodiplosis mosellana]XP_055299780.1 protein kinase C and casein kinase substrate in neurons protein 2 isoform X2 [Sitodiplosis mosellana]XP_055299781.1 protein kinase C and casein kinase substrate in neurons protein 2 isoform X2 [Sitodiplosis mosellana]XP_055299782.1 protein kinase C and casein kina
MSHHSDDQLLQAGSDSFWEAGNYKRTTKRIEDGYKLCTDLQTLIHERAEIEKAYAKSLRAWSKKWGELIEKGPEYGTMEAAWKGILTEAERVSDVHLKVKENLCIGEIQQIKTWQKDNYHKNMLQIKERKEMEDLFKKAQKPWAKHLAKVEKTKADYHGACKTEKTATNQERNASADSSISQDQIKKMQDRVQKTKDEVQKCREKYEQALQEINKYNPIYIEDMTSVFVKCQEMEQTRLCFFKNVLFSIHKTLNVTQDPTLPQIYEEFYHTINNSDHQKDLKWWSNNHGVNMAMNWPNFVEYPPPQNSRNSVKTAIKTTAVRVNKEDSPKSNNSSSHNTSNSPNNRNSTVTNGTNKSEANPFEEGDDGEWDEGDGENILVDNGEPGVPVKALYDYDGAESDELTFKQGEVFEKLEDEDEQGWCKGRKNGRVGLYPANYVEAVAT